MLNIQKLAEDIFKAPSKQDIESRQLVPFDATDLQRELDKSKILLVHYKDISISDVRFIVVLDNKAIDNKIITYDFSKTNGHLYSRFDNDVGLWKRKVDVKNLEQLRKAIIDDLHDVRKNAKVLKRAEDIFKAPSKTELAERCFAASEYVHMTRGRIEIWLSNMIAPAFFFPVEETLKMFPNGGDYRPSDMFTMTDWSLIQLHYENANWKVLVDLTSQNWTQGGGMWYKARLGNKNVIRYDYKGRTRMYLEESK